MLFKLTGYEIPKEHWDTIGIARFHKFGLTGEGPEGYGGVERTLTQLDDAGLQWQHRIKHVSIMLSENGTDRYDKECVLQPFLYLCYPF